MLLNRRSVFVRWFRSGEIYSYFRQKLEGVNGSSFIGVFGILVGRWVDPDEIQKSTDLEFSEVEKKNFFVEGREHFWRKRCRGELKPHFDLSIENLGKIPPPFGRSELR